MNQQQKDTWWKAFCFAMGVAGMPIASGAAVYKALGGTITSVFTTLGSIVTSLKNFKAIAGTSAKLSEWVIWIAKNDPNILAKVRILFPSIAETVGARTAASSLILRPGTMAQAGRVTLPAAAGKSISGTATVAAMIGWTIGSIAYAYMEVYDLNSKIGEKLGFNAVWEAYYREKQQTSSYGFWANWYGVPEKEQETNVLKLKMAKRNEAQKVAQENNVTLNGQHLSLMSASIARSQNQ